MASQSERTWRSMKKASKAEQPEKRSLFPIHLRITLLWITVAFSFH
jgi:hypothetical protein